MVSDGSVSLLRARCFTGEYCCCVGKILIPDSYRQVTHAPTRRYVGVILPGKGKIHECDVEATITKCQADVSAVNASCSNLNVPPVLCRQIVIRESSNA